MSRGGAGRERWEFALDGRQMAAIAVGVLVIVGSAFVLGMNTGKGMARRSTPAVAGNSLEAFDTAHENLPTLPEPKNWEYEKLGGSQASDANPQGGTAQVAASAQARVPPPARQLPAPAPADPKAPADEAQVAGAPTAVAASTPAPAPAAAPEKPAQAARPPAPPRAAPASPRAPAPSAMDRAIAAVGGKPVSSAPVVVASASEPSAFAIQIGASPNRADADRVAKRFASRGARVVAADVDGKRWYRVRLASYSTRAEAERALSRLSRETGVRGFVTAAR